MENVDAVTILGLMAGTFTTLAFLPQVIKMSRSRSSGDISLLMMSLNCTGVFLWLLYGFFLSSIPIILANAVTFALLSYALILTIKHR